MRPTLFALFVTLGWTLACAGGDDADFADLLEEAAAGLPADDAGEANDAEEAQEAQEDAGKAEASGSAAANDNAGKEQADDPEACCAVGAGANASYALGPKSECDKKGGTVVETSKCEEGTREINRDRRVRKPASGGGPVRRTR